MKWGTLTMFDIRVFSCSTLYMIDEHIHYINESDTTERTHTSKDKIIKRKTHIRLCVHAGDRLAYTRRTTPISNRCAIRMKSRQKMATENITHFVVHTAARQRCDAASAQYYTKKTNGFYGVGRMIAYQMRNKTKYE